VPFKSTRAFVVSLIFTKCVLTLL